jgi:hypothetical protein
MWKKIRLVILLSVLAVVLKQRFLDTADLSWKNNFYVAVYPVNADGSAVTAAYIKTLGQADFQPVVDFFASEAQRYSLGMRHPVEVQLGAAVKNIPPVTPVGGNMFDAVVWSLKFRLFAWNNSPSVPVNPKIRLYLLYHNPATSSALKHSTALSKGRVGSINLFADAAYAKQNLVITAHELLHTLTATDKYDLATNLPAHPDGYAEPDKSPRYPQDFAEIMGGRLPVSPTKAVIPDDLSRTLIGDKTAREIGWRK